MITFSDFYAYHREIICIFVVKIWQIRKETPKTKGDNPSIAERAKHRIFRLYRSKEVDGASKGIASSELIPSEMEVEIKTLKRAQLIKKVGNK